VYIVRTGWLAGWLAGWLLSLPERERVREEGWRSEGRRERNVWSC